uniref:S24 family peptidase n=1 Tax=Candidatus Stercorousia sp. TaxID=3048886 RepID=UPI0040255B91
MKLSEYKSKLEEKIKLIVSYGQLADVLGMSRQYISKIKDEELDEKKLNILNSYFNEMSTDNEIKFIQIPVLGNVTASMGHGITIYDETQTGVYEISQKLANDIGIVSSKTQMIFASGDSMYPTIEGGDSLLIDTSKKEVYDGRIYCVRIDGQLYAKRLQKIPPNTIKVISDNEKKYDAFYIDFSKSIDFDFEVIGEIRWWGRVAR